MRLLLLRMRKAWGLAAACVLAVCTALPAWAEPYLWSSHQSNASIMDGKTVYDAARFHRVYLSVEDDDTLAEQKHKDAAGTLKLLGGQYSFHDGTALVDVAGTPREFALAEDEIELGEKGISYMLSDSKGDEIGFQKAADHGLGGVKAEWTFPALPELNGTGIIPNFRTTQQQLDSYVPYVELIKSGANVTGVRWRVVNLGNPAQPRPLDVKSRVRVRIWDRNDRRVYSKWQDSVPANGSPQGEITLESPLAESELYLIRIRLDEWKGNHVYRYEWRFYSREQSDAGIADRGGLKEETITLKAGETRDVSLTLKEGYRAWYGGSALIGDKTILSVDDKDSGGKTAVTFTLKGLKPGKTTLALLYNKDEGDNRMDYIYNTIPVSVVVTDASGNVPGGSSGGGGCDAGFAGLALLAAGALILARKR